MTGVERRRGGMEASANARGEAAQERRRAATVVAGGAGAVFVVLAVGGALSPAPAVFAVLAVLAVTFLYLAASASASASAAAATEIRDARTPVESEPPQPAPVEPAPAPAEAIGADTPHAAPILEMLPDPIVLIGKDGRIEAANAAARAELGLTGRATLLSSVLRDPEVLEAVHEIMRGAAPQSVSYRTAAPRERYTRAFVAGFDPATDEPVKAVIALHDETSVKRAERTRVDFLANASHELRTPLASLAGFIETLRGHARDDAQAREHFLAIMQDQADRMRRLIHDLLSLSRVELNEHVPPTGVADLAAIAGDVADAFAPLAEEREVAIEVTRAEPRAPVLGDRDELLQVVQNLVDNAVKYSARGQTVRIDTGCRAQVADAAYAQARLSPDAGRMSILAPPDELSGGYAWLRVRDEGPGIDGRFLPRLSERFFRIEATDAQERSGTGLGLAIVKHIMSRHRGGLAVESAPGEGSVFAVYAPHTPEFLRAARADAAASTPPPAEPAARPADVTAKAPD